MLDAVDDLSRCPGVEFEGLGAATHQSISPILYLC